MELGTPEVRDQLDELPSRHTRLEIIATRDPTEDPERWTTDLTVDDRTIALGTFPSIGKALITGIRAYYDTKVPKHLRRKRQELLD